MTDISIKVHLLHREEDKFAPVRFVKYLDEKIPLSQLHVFPEEGHFYMMKNFDLVFEQVSLKKSSK